MVGKDWSERPLSPPGLPPGEGEPFTSLEDLRQTPGGGLGAGVENCRRATQPPDPTPLPSLRLWLHQQWLAVLIE